MDGARLFNASVFLGVPAADLARHADSVTINLNKGLCAPFGSILAGSADFIGRVVHARQRFGGGWRPVGLPAAAGIVALEQMVERLSEDHQRARRLARLLGEIDGVSILNEPVQTNLVCIRIEADGMNQKSIMEFLEARGVLSLAYAGNMIRFAIHNDISDADVDHVGDVFRDLMDAATG